MKASNLFLTHVLFSWLTASVIHKNRYKKAPRILRWWSFLEKPHAGIADQNNLLEGPKLFCGKLTPVVGICQGITL